MPQKRIDKDKIITAFLSLAFDKSAGAVSLADIANVLGVKKASLYNHFASRDEMYAETVAFCAKYLESVSFYVDDFASGKKSADSETVSSGSEFFSQVEAASANAPLAEKSLSADIAQTNTPRLAEKFSALIMQYFRSHTMEPLLQVYSFIHSEKYFNETASHAAENAKQKITEDVQKILSQANVPQSADTTYLATTQQNGGTSRLANAPQLIATIILQSLDSYVLQRKDAIRKNPEQVAGSLFELPFEETIQQKLIAQVTEILRLCA